jgi:hypothetical protein
MVNVWSFCSTGNAFSRLVASVLIAASAVGAVTPSLKRPININCWPVRLDNASCESLAKSLITASYALSGTQISGDRTGSMPEKVRGKTPITVKERPLIWICEPSTDAARLCRVQ